MYHTSLRSSPWPSLVFSYQVLILAVYRFNASTLKPSQRDSTEARTGLVRNASKQLLEVSGVILSNDHGATWGRFLANLVQKCSAHIDPSFPLYVAFRRAIKHRFLYRATHTLPSYPMVGSYGSEQSF